MATTPIVFMYPPGETLTFDVFSIDSDTASQSGITATEETNRDGRYEGDYTGTNTGWHEIHVKEGGVVVAVFYVYLRDNTDHHFAIDVPLDLVSQARLAGVSADEISGDAAAADNLEAMYDGTGYTDDTGPASRLQVSDIGAASGGAVNFAPIEDNTGGAIIDGVTFVGSVVSGTFADVGPGINNSHSINDTGNDIDIVYGYQVGGNRQGTNIIVNADVDGGADQLEVEVYNHVTSSWDVLGIVDDNELLNLPITQAHTGTGSELGKVYVRFDNNQGDTPSNLEVFELLVSAVNIGNSVGYTNGRIFIDTNNGTAGAEPYVNGTADNPVDSIADAKTLSTSLGLPDFHIFIGSSITLAESTVNESYFGDNWTLALGGQDIDGAQFTGANVSGNDTGSNSTAPIFNKCMMGSNTLGKHELHNCELTGDIVLQEAANYVWDGCYSDTGTPSVDFQSAAETKNLACSHWSGDLEVKNLGAGSGTHVMKIEGDGKLTVASTSTGGALNVRGAMRMVDNSGGGPSLEITPDVTGYQQGSVWVDETNGTSTGTVVGIDGTFQNQSDDFDNAQDVADSLGTSRITIHPGNSVTLTDSLQGYTIENVQATLDGGSQDVDSTRINGGFVTGTWTRAGTGVPTFATCNINNVTSDRVACLANCGILGTFTMSEAGVYVFNDAQAAGGSATATIDFDSNAATASIQRWSGGLTVNNLVSGATLLIHAVSGDDITINGADATVEISGVIGSFTNNMTGGTVTNNAITLANINTEVDTALTDIKLDHLVAVAESDDPVDDSIIAKLAASDGDWSGFDNSTDSLEAVRDHVGDGTNLTEAGGTGDHLTALSSHSAADVWTSGTRTLTANTNLNDPTAAAIAAEVLAGGDVDGFTLEETLKLCLAALAGKLSGAAGTTVTIRAADDSKARITATVDESGNRSAVTLDETG